MWRRIVMFFFGSLIRDIVHEEVKNSNFMKQVRQVQTNTATRLRMIEDVLIRASKPRPPGNHMDMSTHDFGNRVER
jgi:hypothetical protein